MNKWNDQCDNLLANPIGRCNVYRKIDYNSYTHLSKTSVYLCIYSRRIHEVYPL